MVIGLLVLLPYLVSIIPYLPSASFRQNALFAPQMDKVLFAKIPLSGGEAIFIVPTILVILYLLYIRKEKDYSNIAAFVTAALLSILSFTHIHPQWFLWVTPLLILLALRKISSAESAVVGLLLISWVVSLFLFEGSLQVNLFAPLFPILADIPGPTEIIKEPSLTLIRSAVASLFAASSLYLSARLVTGNPKNE